MKLKSTVVLIAVASGCGVANIAMAADGSQWQYKFDPRFYLGVGAGQSTLKPDTSGVPDRDVIDDSDSGAHFLFGWDYSRRIAFEFQYADLGRAGLALDGHISYQETSLSGLYYLWNSRTDDQYSDLDGLDLREGFSLFGRIGVGKMDNDANLGFRRTNDVQILGGAGLEYGMSNGFAVRGEGIVYDTDAKYASLSLLYRFGDPAESSEEYHLPSLPPPAEQAELPGVTSTLPTPGEEGDADADGVADLVDDCAGSRLGSQVNEYGCETFGGTLEGVNFLTASDTLTDEARVILDDVAQTMLTSGVRVSVEAHTDGRGDPKANLDLSRRRALSVVRYLTAHGVPLDRFEARAFGESRPVASDDTPEGRLMNRRVEIYPLQ